jgi:RNA polymerase sigma factor (sigma-70 family)
MGPSIPVRLLATQSDARLVELAMQGHERAFEALVLRYRRALLGYCRRLPLSGGLAEDALQQGLLQAWLALQSGTEVRDPKPWLYRIVRNAALNMRRGTPVEHSELSETVSAGDTPEDELYRQVAVRGVLAGLVALPEHQREALLRTAVEGHSHEQVAAALGLSDGAVRGLVYRARATLRAAATAITPSPFLNWALSSGARGPSVAAIVELSAGGGSIGLGGLLLKGGAFAATAGALVTSIGGGHPHGTVASHHAQRASAKPAPHRVAASEPPSKPRVTLIADRPQPATELVHRAPAARTVGPRIRAAALAKHRTSIRRAGDSRDGDHAGDHNSRRTSTGGGESSGDHSSSATSTGGDGGAGGQGGNSPRSRASAEGGGSSSTPQGPGDGGSGSAAIDRGNSNNTSHSSGDGSSSGSPDGVARSRSSDSGSTSRSSDGGSNHALKTPGVDVGGTSSATATSRSSAPSDGGGASNPASGDSGGGASKPPSGDSGGGASNPPSGDASGGASGSGSGGSAGGATGSDGLLAGTAAPSAPSSGGG